MKNDYKDGFYYVNSKISGEQSIAQREQGSWWMIGCSERLNSDDFTAIGPMLGIPGDDDNE